ncbi:MAG TPA: aminomethyl-transferring glycine dehydrogenase [Thermomicrobiaceae bacterium]|nr:aminomethyl-transferring glycine dehydrogenase [Thermomicrobiaceae bacterium]
MGASKTAIPSLDYTDRFENRHIGPRPDQIEKMLSYLGFNTLDDLIDAAIPRQIRTTRPLSFAGIGGVVGEQSRSEHEALQDLKALASQNKMYRSYIGMGYYNTITPPVILRNILENPGWYTQYTPYQAEIAQGRLEALINFQTVVTDLTGLEIANASLLDEATAAAEAMAMAHAIKVRKGNPAFFVSDECHPQTVAVVQTRAGALDIPVIVGDWRTVAFDQPVFGVLLQYPTTYGAVEDYAPFIEKAHAAGALAIVAADILSLTLLRPPAEFGADIAVGTTQRFGVPLGYGGPHAAYLSTKDEYKRQIPGRICGVSIDAEGKPAVRLALQTREQHIRREKATSNICTAQVLLAVVAGMYAVWHGPEGLKEIARRVHLLTATLDAGLKRLGYDTGDQLYFDTLRVDTGKTSAHLIVERALAHEINLRPIDDHTLGISLDQVTSQGDVAELLTIFNGDQPLDFELDGIVPSLAIAYPSPHARETPYLEHPVFNTHHSETEMLRYITRLEHRDLSLNYSMIPLGSCTMKLNATAEMIPVTWPEFGGIHPYVPQGQTPGYHEMMTRLEKMLAEITGFDEVSLQPNAGSQGEYTGLLVIREYQTSRGQGHRDVCLIPSSAHGTNPASATMAGFKVVVVKCDSEGNIEVDDLRAKAEQHQENLAALMVTYPSTHGVFEESIVEICDVVHQHGGQVYMDGANMNAQVGLCRPAEIGADVCHLNLHKTFCIPHGGGGPGMGPIGVKSHLAPYLPTHPVIHIGGPEGIGPVAAAPFGSPSILTISYAYISMMGAHGLTDATRVAILNANYIAKRLDPHFPVLYKGKNGMVAHECIVDLRQLKERTGIEVADVAKRLMDYGFHAPTISFPVPGTMMIEPTESEDMGEIDRFCDALIAIRDEIAEIELGMADREDNVLKNAPHTSLAIAGDEWEHPYSRMKAAYPAHWLIGNKFWPPVARINDVYGDRNLVCACPPVESYAD